MTPEVIPFNGETLSLEATLNGQKRLEVRFWRPKTDAVVWADTLNPVSGAERDRVLERLPVDCRPEAEGHLLALADAVVAHRQNSAGSIPPNEPTTAQPSATSDETREELEARCRDLTGLPNILDRVAEVIREAGVVESDRQVKLIYLALTSRLLARPVSLAVKGPSAAGKSFPVEQVLRLFPDSAYYEFTAMSERALAYGEEPLAHRMLVFYEAAGMTGDTASYLIRSLLSEGRIRYQTVEKIDGGLRTRVIERPGPTGLITTTTQVTLHPENETRLLSLPVSDSAEQTRAILRALAGDARPIVNVEPWQDLQRWLEAGERRVGIPFARQLADLIPAVAVRLRRDFGALLNLIRANALLHQGSRGRDGEGRIIAIIEDYASVRELVADLMSEGVEATVSPTMRETVVAVRSLTRDEHGEATVTGVGQALGLDKSSAWRRVRAATEKGYLRNLETGRGRPARLVLGDALPDEVELLPSPERLADGCTVAGQTEGVGQDVVSDDRGDAWEPPEPGLGRVAA